MSKGYLLESDVENLALDTLQKVGYDVYKSPSPTSTNPEIDKLRNNDHAVAILTEQLQIALKKINPGYSEKIYKEALRQLTRLADNPDLMKLNIIKYDDREIYKKSSRRDYDLYLAKIK